jgi:hypothetical protein
MSASNPESWSETLPNVGLLKRHDLKKYPTKKTFPKAVQIWDTLGVQ